MKVDIIGNIFGLSGYDRHTRGLANALNDVGIDVKLSVSLIEQWERQVNDFELNAITKTFDKDRTMIAITQPQHWRLYLAQKPKHFFGFCVWEGDKVPEYWLPYLFDTRVNKILVPSNHTKDAIIKTIRNYPNITVKNLDNINKTVNKIHIIPHGYDSSKYYPDKKKPNKKFTFLANKGWSQGAYDRGGMQYIFKAFTEEFTNKDNVCLKAKINMSYNAPNWNHKEELKKIGIIKNKDTPEILLNLSNLNDKALNNFYNEGDVFISTSMAEAFNLPVIEAMATGIPAIVTEFGGQSDFVNSDNGYLINKGHLINYSKEIAYEETKWFKPSIAKIRNVMRRAYENQKEVKEKGKKALLKASEYTWIQASKKLKKLLF